MDDMKSIIAIALNVGKLFGCTPIRLGLRTITTTYLILPYNALFLTGYVALIILDEIHKEKDDAYVAAFVNTLGLLASTLQTFVNLIFNWVNINDLKDMVKTVLQVDKKMVRLTGAKLNFGKLKGIAFGALAAIALAVSLSTGYEYYSLIHVEMSQKLRFVLVYAAMALTGVVAFQIAVFSMIIHELYGSLHAYLLKILDNRAKLKRTYAGHYLEDFRTTLVVLNRVSATFNRCFSKQLLLIFANGFITITVHSYHALKDVRTFHEYYIAYGSKISLFFGYIVLVATAFQLIANKVESIGCTLLKFPQDNFGTLTNEAFLISQQLVKSPVVFTASNFFDVNVSSILTVVGTICSYLIILMQSNAGKRKIYTYNDNQQAYIMRT